MKGVFYIFEEFSPLYPEDPISSPDLPSISHLKVVVRDEELDRSFDNDGSVVAPTVVDLQGVKDLLKQRSPPES